MYHLQDTQTWTSHLKTGLLFGHLFIYRAYSTGIFCPQSSHAEEGRARPKQLARDLKYIEILKGASVHKPRWPVKSGSHLQKLTWACHQSLTLMMDHIVTFIIDGVGPHVSVLPA